MLTVTGKRPPPPGCILQRSGFHDSAATRTHGAGLTTRREKSEKDTRVGEKKREQAREHRSFNRPESGAVP